VSKESRDRTHRKSWKRKSYLRLNPIIKKREEKYHQQRKRYLNVTKVDEKGKETGRKMMEKGGDSQKTRVESRLK